MEVSVSEAVVHADEFFTLYDEFICICHRSANHLHTQFFMPIFLQKLPMKECHELGKCFAM